MEDRSYWDKNALTRPQFDNPVTREFIYSVIGQIRKKIPDLSRLTILDCGCGNGRFLYYFNRLFRKAHGFDYSRQMVKEAKAAGIRNVQQADGMKIPAKSGTYDVAFGACYIHNLKSEKKAVQEMVRVSGKYIVIVEPNPISALGIYHLVSPTEELHSLKFTGLYIRKVLRQCNAHVIYSNKFCYITPNKTPKRMLNLLKAVPLQGIFGFYTITIAEKRKGTMLS
jgi:ubiquinone/menaquinone biosynthesis C-methylase UbiE